MERERIEQAATKLGAGVQIDAEAVAERVVAELRAQPLAARIWWRRTSVLRIAAVLAVLVTGGVIMKRLATDDPAAAVVEMPVGMEAFSAAQLAEVLDSLDLMTPVADMGPVLLDDLDEEQLTALLAAMEG
jgi:hypothetical protein